MKKLFSSIMMVIVALCVGATDRFYIEDFRIWPGQTLTVSIMLENEAEYTAFQTDIYLPEGLTIEQEDGDYIFDLTDRKARDHNIASQLQMDGSIRVMSYSPTIKTYSGNSGALVTFKVTASADFKAPATIWLKNTLFTTVAAVEIPFGDEVCTVRSGLKGDVNMDGAVDISDATMLINYLLDGNSVDVNSIAADVNEDSAIDISDATTLINYLLYGEWPVITEGFTVNGVSFTMVTVEGGSFMMGATEEEDADYQVFKGSPKHQVTLSTYRIGQTEVTQELWLAVMGSNPSADQSDLQYPVNNVSWNDCDTFITRLNALTGMRFRLPTEAEWEFAAQGGSRSKGYVYSGSSDLDEVAWINTNSENHVHQVGTKKANELGLYDMNGNIEEWCNDWYSLYTEDPVVNPTGPETGMSRIHRGGRWSSGAKFCRITRRDGFSPGVTRNYLGLRLAL
ncbi:MAG: SUMF1/EgtB/PvdO family nonheme iron enzyme [Muribaculaceae bacterium]|nr:SUMF1/EgtB/PvdO family nonheme iron enzyme [Muribaculaceae bacterium]